MLEFVWTGDLDDDCSCASVEPYTCHVWRVPGDAAGWAATVEAGTRSVFHDGVFGVVILTADAARQLCQMAVTWDRQVRQIGYGVVLKGDVQ